VHLIDNIPHNSNQTEFLLIHWNYEFPSNLERQNLENMKHNGVKAKPMQILSHALKYTDLDDDVWETSSSSGPGTSFTGSDNGSLGSASGGITVPSTLSYSSSSSSIPSCSSALLKSRMMAPPVNSPSPRPHLGDLISSRGSSNGPLVSAESISPSGSGSSPSSSGSKTNNLITFTRKPSSTSVVPAERPLSMFGGSTNNSGNFEKEIPGANQDVGLSFYVIFLIPSASLTPSWSIHISSFITSSSSLSLSLSPSFSLPFPSQSHSHAYMSLNVTSHLTLSPAVEKTSCAYERSC
jgi:hypothetical protein